MGPRYVIHTRADRNPLEVKAVSRWGVAAGKGFALLIADRTRSATAPLEVMSIACCGRASFPSLLVSWPTAATNKRWEINEYALIEFIDWLTPAPRLF